MKMRDERKMKRMKIKIHNFIIQIIDFLMVASWLIGASAVDCESNDMRIVWAMMIIPMIWGCLRHIAENYEIVERE